MCHTISKRKYTTDLSISNLEILSHSLETTANHIVRLYVAIKNPPTENLPQNTSRVSPVYTLVQLIIKCNPSCKDGAMNISQLITKSR